jgi:hypothetical protein
LTQSSSSAESVKIEKILVDSNKYRILKDDIYKKVEIFTTSFNVDIQN